MKGKAWKEYKRPRSQWDCVIDGGRRHRWAQSADNQNGEYCRECGKVRVSVAISKSKSRKGKARVWKGDVVISEEYDAAADVWTLCLFCCRAGIPKWLHRIASPDNEGGNDEVSVTIRELKPRKVRGKGA